MLTGFNVLVCGSSAITQDHIKALKNLKINVDGIYSGNNNKVNEISKKFNLKIINNFSKQDLKNYNTILITSSSSKHLKYIEMASEYIRNIIVEKPIVLNMNEFNLLKKISINKKIFIKEINLFDIKLKKTFFNTVKINIKKKRTYDDFVNFKGEIDTSKSPIINHLPHAYDLACLYLKKKFTLSKSNFVKFDKLLGFHKQIILQLSDDKKKVIIDIDLASDKNYKNKITYTFKNNFLNFFSIPLNFLMKLFNYSSFIDTKNKVPILENFYKNFFSEISYDGQKNYILYLENKIQFVNKVWELSKKRIS